MTDHAKPIDDFITRHSLVFDDLDLLQQAFTHRSFTHERRRSQPHLKHNERLEFLGDAVIDFIAGDWLFDRFPDEREGNLTRLRSQLVRKEMLAEFALIVGLDAYIRFGIGEEDTGGRERPSVLSDAFEAFIGALYRDQGEPTARAFVEPLFAPALEQVLKQGSTKDPKTRLQEWTQAQPENITPTYHTIAQTGPDHDKRFVAEVRLIDAPIGWGNGRSKRWAEQNAAYQALENLGADPTAEPPKKKRRQASKRGSRGRRGGRGRSKRNANNL